ncbi:MAG: hypothetical protein KAS93_01835 [Gammaproteobacteria bacterium]|nr:hypothetical protein [Gammaproteobacteria bacterium]
MSKRNENRPGYKKTKIGWMPEEWDVCGFGNIATLCKEKINPKKTKQNIPCVELEHIEQRTGNILGNVDLNNQSSQKSLFKKDNVLFGKLRPYLRKYAYCSFDGACSTEIWVLKNTAQVCSKFLFLLIQTDGFITVANKTSGTKMPRADWKSMADYLVAIPPTYE